MKKVTHRLLAFALAFSGACAIQPGMEEVNKSQSVSETTTMNLGGTSGNALYPMPGSGNCGYPLQTNAVTPVFGNVPLSFHQYLFQVPMESLWGAFGLQHANGDPLIGYNYFLLPSASPGTNGSSDHFNPLSSYFQTFFGYYNIINASNGSSYGFNANGTINPSAFINIAVPDQQAWLLNFAGVPFSSLSVSGVKTPQVSSVYDYNLGTTVWTIKTLMRSNVDVGPNNIGYNGNTNYNVYPYCADPTLFNSPPSLWQNKQPWLTNSGYSVVLLDVVLKIWRSNNQVNLIYYNGYLNPKTGVSTLVDIGEQLEEMAAGVMIEEIM